MTKRQRAILAINGFLNGVMEDVDRAHNEWLGQKDQYHARALVRSLFATFEGTTHFLKQLVVSEADVGELSEAEHCLLMNRDYQLKENGEVRIKQQHVNFTANVLFACRMAAKSLWKTPWTPPHGKGWTAFKEATLIRDRLMHPKSLTELGVSEQELDKCYEAFEWWMDSLVGVSPAKPVTKKTRKRT